MCRWPAAGTDGVIYMCMNERRKTSEMEYDTARNIRQVVITLWIYGIETRTKSEVNSVRKHNYNCMLDDGIY